MIINIIILSSNVWSGETLKELKEIEYDKSWRLKRHKKLIEMEYSELSRVEKLKKLRQLQRTPLSPDELKQQELQNQITRSIKTAERRIISDKKRKQKEIKNSKYNALKKKQKHTKEILFKDKWDKTIERKEKKYLQVILNNYIQKELKKGTSLKDIQALMEEKETKEYFKMQVQRQIKINIDNGIMFKAYIKSLNLQEVIIEY